MQSPPTVDGEWTADSVRNACLTVLRPLEKEHQTRRSHTHNHIREASQNKLLKGSDLSNHAERKHCCAELRPLRVTKPKERPFVRPSVFLPLPQADGHAGSQRTGNISLRSC
jgi:hypothetical protein